MPKLISVETIAIQFELIRFPNKLKYIILFNLIEYVQERKVKVSVSRAVSVWISK